MRRWFIFITMLIFITLILFLGYYINRTKIAEMKLYPSEFGNLYHVLDDGTTNWRVRTIQPIVIGYRTFGKANYMIILNRNDRRWYSAHIFLTGEVNGKSNDKMLVTDKDGGYEVLTYPQIKKRFRFGDRVRIQYLDTHLLSDNKPSDEFCAQYVPACLYLEFGQVQQTSLSSIQSLIWKPTDSYGAMSL
jgi:hypothetical protein